MAKKLFNLWNGCIRNYSKTPQTVLLLHAITAVCHVRTCTQSVNKPYHDDSFDLRAAKMFCRRLERSVSFLRNGWSSSSLALARFSTSTSRQRSRKPIRSADSFDFDDSLISGLPLVAIRNSALTGVSFKYGGSPSIISITMIPRLHTSTLLP